MAQVEVLTFPSGPFQTNGYLVIAGTAAAIIDAPPELHTHIEEVVEERNLTIEKVILTHSHWDHIADTKLLHELYHVPVLVHEEDVPNLVKPGSDGLPLRMEIMPYTPDLILHEGDTVMIGKSSWQVIHTPGHSPGGISLYCPEAKILFSGDTLFKSSIGNLSFPTSDAKRMWPSLKKLGGLPKETIVYPGHGPSTTIGQEKWLHRAEEIFGGD